MSTAIAKRPPQSESVETSRYDDPGMIETLKMTVAKHTTESEFRMFIEICKSTGLNPFLREIWCVVPMKDGQRSQYGQVLIMAGRDGYLRVANDHPMFDGMETRVERDPKGIPIKAVCTVWRKDRNHPTISEAYFNEYYKPGYNGKPSVWDIYKSAMIGKVAEVLALKRSFSINGVVTEEEIGTQGPPREAQQEVAGSREAQQEVAERKIAELKGVRLVHEDNLGVGIQDAEIIHPTELEEQLQESINNAKEMAAEKARKEVYFNDLKKFGALKKKITEDTGSDRLYYETLASLGYEHANEIPASKMVPIYRYVSRAYTDWKSAQPPIEEA